MGRRRTGWFGSGGNLFAFVVLTGALVAVFAIPSLATGMLGLGVVWRVAASRWGTRNGVWAALLVACVYASSREIGLQYWKWLRFVPTLGLCVHSLRVYRQASATERTATVRFAAILFGVALISAVFSAYPADGVFEAVLLGLLWPAMALCCTVVGEEEYERTEAMLLHLAVAVLLASLVIGLVNVPASQLHGRFRGIFGNPNEFSHWWLLMFVVAGIHTIRTGVNRYVVWSAGTLILLIFTGTRGALIGVLLSGMGFVLTWLRVRPLLGWVLLLGASGVAVLKPEVMLEPAKRLLPATLLREETIEMGGGRLVAWEFGWNEALKHPWIGHGGGYEERVYREFEEELSLRNHQGFSHNSWLAFVINFGIPGGTLLIAWLLSRLRLFGSPLALIALPPMLASLAVEGWLTAPLSASSPLFFAVAGLAAAAVSPHTSRSDGRR